MGQPEFETSPNINMVGLVHILTRDLWSTGNAVIIDSGFRVFKGLLEISTRGVYVSALINIGAIGLGGFM